MESTWKITVLVNNYAREMGFRAEHGLALLLENPFSASMVLLDGGQSAEVLLHNAAVLGTDWSKLTAVVLSHGHYDHTGGLAALFASLDHKVALHHHPDAFLPKAALKPHFRSIGTSQEEIARGNAVFFPSRNDTALAEDLWITGEIPRVEPLDREASAGFYQSKDGEMREDTVADDRSIVIEKPGRGFYLVSGCCHSGLINTIRYVKEKARNKKLLGLLGGLHTIGASQGRLEAVVRELKKENPDYVAPIHCSGPKETAVLFRDLGAEKVKFLSVGDSVTF